MIYSVTEGCWKNPGGIEMWSKVEEKLTKRRRDFIEKGEMRKVNEEFCE